MTPKHLLTTVGGIEVPRRYYACRQCKAKRTPWDDWAGIDSIQVTPHARKLIVAVSTVWSFDRASAKLKDLCHVKVSDDTIERVCQHEGEQARQWLRGNPRTREAFEKAPGEPEFYSDGLKVNTREGWREMRLNLLQKRARGTPVAPEKWKDRVLPEASVRLASCAIADCRRVGAMWQQWSGQMGLENSAQLSVIADGAPWIWEQARQRLSPQASWCVDVYHVSEDLHQCAKSMLGEGEPARSWAQRELEELIRVGGPKYLQRLDQQIGATTEPPHLKALRALRVYLEGNQDRMWYADRLKEGKPIGSGAIEGACKKIGARLKLNSARWRLRRAERFGALLCLEYADQANTYWSSKAA
ncbi:MAG: hypothetical protein H7210_08300 [Pyrinomonadaceae bacterium]|nr:hypothetical protein [Phycisphaerales bacterium]